MRKLFSLIRASMTEGMRIFTYSAKDERSKKTLPLVLAGIAFLSIFSYANVLAATLRENGNASLVLAIFTILTTILTVMEGVYKSGSLLFSCRDNDMLLSLPLKKSEIVFLRIFKFYVFELLYNSLFLLPAIFAFTLNADNDASFILVAVVMLLLLPIFPIALASILGAISSALSSRFKKKNLIQVIFTMVFLVGTVFLSGAMGSFAENEGEVLSCAGEISANVYYPAKVFVELSENFDMVQVLVFILINFAVLGILVFVLSRFYFQIVSRINVSRQDSKLGKIRFSPRRKTVSLIRKEIIKYFNTPVLVSNTMFGLVLFLVAVGAVALKSEDIITSLVEGEFPLTREEILRFMPFVTFAMVTFSSLLTFITTTMISLERKAFNILKTIPVSPQKIFFSKILASLVLTVPMLLVGDLIMFFSFDFSALEILLVLAGTMLFPLATETLGILIDLKYARFDAENDSEIVKQSTGVLTASFVGLFSTIATISVSAVLVFLIGSESGMAIVDGVYVVIFLVLFSQLKKKGGKRFSQLSA